MFNVEKLFNVEKRLSVLILHVDEEGQRNMYMVDRAFFNRHSRIRGLKNLADVRLIESEETAAKRVLRLIAPNRNEFDYELVPVRALGVKTRGVAWFCPPDWRLDENPLAKSSILSAAMIEAIKPAHRVSFAKLCHEANMAHQAKTQPVPRSAANAA